MTKTIKRKPAEAFTDGCPYERWCEEYRPLKNAVCERASFDGAMFETFGDELAFIKDQPIGCVWTLIEADDDCLVILSGFHFVNRLGHFVTERPWEGVGTAEIPLDDAPSC